MVGLRYRKLLWMHHPSIRSNEGWTSKQRYGLLKRSAFYVHHSLKFKFKFRAGLVLGLFVKAPSSNCQPNGAGRLTLSGSIY